jgi:hypothetical protein
MQSRRIRLAMTALLALGTHACFTPPPKIPSVPATGLALRLYVFGASAVDAQRTFAAVKVNNPTFALVNAGGNGEVLVGLENDSPRCVPPTAMCSYRVSYRIKDSSGAIVAAETTTVEATSDRCSDLCAQALNDVAVKLVDVAASRLAGAVVAKDADARLEDAGAPPVRATDAAPSARAKRSTKSEARPEPPICSAGHGARLPTEEAERRAAQVAVLKRLGVVDPDEYDCLRKAYLDRL